jgi:hypothetical protein
VVIGSGIQAQRRDIEYAAPFVLFVLNSSGFYTFILLQGPPAGDKLKAWRILNW